MNNNEAFAPYLKFVLQALRDEKCILCIGPDFYSEMGGMRLEQQLAAHLRDEAEVLDISVYDDGWFHALSGDESLAYESVREFYGKPNAHAQSVLNKVVQIPFHLIVSFTPDYNLQEAFRGLNANFATYHRQSPLILAAKPTAKQPLALNLLGELNQRNSLVLTNTDYYDFLKSIFERKQLPEMLRSQIADAGFILFLGMAFDKWYVQLFTQLVTELDSLKKTGAKKIASSVFLDNETLKNIGEQFNLLFKIGQIEPFVDTLLEACKADSQLQKLVRQPDNEALNDTHPQKVSISVNPDEWKNWLAEGKQEQLFETLSPWLTALGEPGKPLFNQLTLLRSRWSGVKNGVQQGIVSSQEAETIRNKITFSLIELLDQIKATFA